MHPFEVTLDEEDVLASVRRWVALLADDRFDLAAAALAYPEDAKLRYTPDDLRNAIGQYSRKYCESPPSTRDTFRPRVSHADRLDSEGERFDWYPHESAPTALADYALPLDEEWSDLTATFFVFPQEGVHRLSLYDIRVS